MDKKFNEQDSLRIISEMIVLARNNFQRDSLVFSLFWGYFIAILGLINFILLQVLPPTLRYKSYNIWWLTIIGFIISFLLKLRKSRKQTVKTHIDKIINYTWWGFGASVLTFYVIVNVLVFKGQSQMLYMSPIILIMCGLAQFVTAVTARYKPYYWGAVIFWICAILAALVTVYTKLIDYQFLVLSFAMIVNFIIPNHILMCKNKNHDV